MCERTGRARYGRGHNIEDHTVIDDDWVNPHDCNPLDEQRNVEFDECEPVGTGRASDHRSLVRALPRANVEWRPVDAAEHALFRTLRQHRTRRK